MRWTKAFRKVHGKEMTVDTTFEMEKRRNRPVKYDRDLVGTTLRAMQRASEVQEKRAELHYVNRMAAHKVKAAVRARVEIKQGVDLIEASVAQKEVVSVDKMETQKQQVQI